MKHYRAISILLTFVLGINGAKGQDMQRSSSEAVNIAEQYLQKRQGINQPGNTNVIQQLQNSKRDILIYEVEKGGISVLVSGHKGCIPVLGCFKSMELSLIEEFKSNSLPLNITLFINGYIEQLEYAFESDDTNQYYTERTFAIFNDSILFDNTRVNEVFPLLTSKWGQSRSNDRHYVSGVGWQGGEENAYNIDIPSVDTCLHALVGCVAVSMGQVMNYWQHPVVDSKLFTQFDWCNMSDMLISTDTNYEIHREAIGYLLLHCAKSANMSFGCKKSSASMDAAKNALKDIYDFDDNISLKHRFLYSNSDWVDMLQEELRNGRPIIYAANRYEGVFEWPGHAFVCDGYNEEEFHINWGWNGSCDGYFTLNNLRPQDSLFYKYNHSAIIGIRPIADDDICQYHLNLSDFYESFYSISSHSGITSYSVTPQTATKLTSASPSSSTLWRTIPANATAVYQAHEEVVLRDGFTAARGCDFTARIVPCERCAERDMTEHDTHMADNADYGNHDNSDGPIAYAAGRMEDSDGLYPNPTDGQVTVATDGKVESLIIYTAAGRPVGGWKYLGIGENRVTLDVSRLPQGAYLLRIHTPQGVATKKLTVRR